MAERRKGEYANVTPEAVLALRRRHGLTQVELAALAGSSIFNGKRGLYARRVQAWEAGPSTGRSNRIPLANWEMLQVRLLLLERGIATLDELCSLPLVDLVQNSIDMVKKTKTGNSMLPDISPLEHISPLELEAEKMIASATFSWNTPKVK